MCSVSSVDPLRRLLDAAVEGDNIAVGELVRRSQGKVFKLCQALGTSGEEEDPRSGDLSARIGLFGHVPR